jgi:hypothetical protein
MQIFVEQEKRLFGIKQPFVRNYLLLFSHCWLAIPQLVLQADWQDVWHSPQPPFFALWQRLSVLIVLICSIVLTSEIS